MHVVAIVPMYPPRSRVGAWLATHLLLEALTARGHRVDVLTRQAAGPVYDLDGVVVGSGRVTHLVDVAIAVADVVVSHAGDDGLASTLAAKWGRPSVRMVHGGHRDLAERLDGCALAVFNSHSLAAEWDGPSIVCHPPLRFDRYATTPGDRVTLVNLSEPKGGDLFWRLARNAPDTKFLAVSGGYGRQIKDTAPNVETLAVTENMRDVFSRTRILLMPSEQETWGMVALEAACSGIPTIAHPTPGLVESLGGSAVFVDRADPQGWLDAIAALLTDPARWAARSVLARNRALEVAADDGTERFCETIEALAGVPCN